MHPILVLELLVLLVLANGAPVIAKKLFRDRMAWPLDGGIAFVDGRPLFGASKTIRGIALALLAAVAGALAFGFDGTIGLAVGGSAMAGDLCSSFTKRRLNLAPSSMAIGLDQIPESLFPLLACRHALSLTAIDITAGVVLFFGGELLLSRLLFAAHIRDRPY
jgi:CDP-2,3-bis-(O-geranylgeranyl)-sn-glycerol synthase